MDHTATLRQVYELINAHDIDAFGENLADDFVEHEELPGGSPTRDGVKAFFRMQIAAFPDLAMTPEDIVDGGDKVVARVRFTGTHEGEFMGMPPTGKTVDVQVIDIMRFADDGLVHEHWGVFDAMGMMRQLSADEA
jgi:steroid delta-isomerase-like uncharacterized protein